MTDIVERLRQGWRIELSDEELCEAADEIERLRGWLINLRGDVLDVAGACNRLADQIGKVLGEESDD